MHPSFPPRLPLGWWRLNFQRIVFEAAALVTERFYVACKVPLPPAALHFKLCSKIKSNRRKEAGFGCCRAPWWTLAIRGHLLPVRPAGGSGAAIICSDKGRFRGGHGVARVHTRKDSDDGLHRHHSATPLSCGEQSLSQKLFFRVRSQLST